jgi:hypothetical protein
LAKLKGMEKAPGFSDRIADPESGSFFYQVLLP